MNVSFTLYLDLQVHRERQYGSCRDGSGESYSIFSFAQSHFLGRITTAVGSPFRLQKGTPNAQLQSTRSRDVDSMFAESFI